MEARKKYNPGMTQDDNDSSNQPQEFKLTGKVKVRYAETKMVKDMRENFEKREKIAQRSSKTYREITKSKKAKAMDIQEIAQRGTGEHYIDSARQIAVGMGVTDVKDTLAEFEDQITQLSRLTPTDELNIHILVEQAAYELRQHKPEEALKFVHAGLRKNMNSLPMQELKGKCFIAMNRYRDALEAADAILKNPYNLNWSKSGNENSTALTVKAFALYNLGDFEHALLAFHRAVKISNMQNRMILKEGIKLAELGVMNAVGSTKTHYFHNLSKVIDLMPINLMGIEWYKLKDYIEKNETCVGKKKKDRRFLDRLAGDKYYLESIIEKVAPAPAKSKSNKNISFNSNSLATNLIVNEAQTALNFLEERREFWSQQNPDCKKSKDKTNQEPEKQQNWNKIQNRMGPQKISIFCQEE